ncbi:MAG: ATP-binding domain-containing protein [Coriobacteriales bacterium]|jgi:DNA helicase-2/ATP-dependent DNA helicase PcrA
MPATHDTHADAPADPAAGGMSRPAGRADDPTFAAEQGHLSATYAKLEQLHDLTQRHLDDTLSEVKAFKGGIADEVSIDLGDADEYDVSMETYAQYAVMNNVIDSFNMSIDSDNDSLARIHQLLPQPYFAKVTLQFPGRPAPREIYFGSTGITDEHHHQLIVDWRAPVAETYYNQGNGPMTYEANGRTVNCDLKLRRQFDVDHDRLRAYFDTTVAIEDPMLLDSLSRRRSAQLQAITATIQSEQNRVIRHPDVPALLVRGVAGSGKTSVMLQRIAYLLYRQRESLSADQVVLVTPNPVFERYIWNVLPQLGEKNPRTMRWEQLIDRLGPGDRARGDDVSAQTLRDLEDGLAGLQLGPDDVREVRVGDWVLLSAKQVWGVVSRLLAKTPPSPRLCERVEEELLFRLEQRVRGMAKEDRLRDEMLSLDDDEQEEVFGSPIRPDVEDEEEMLGYARIYAEWIGAPAIEQVERADWLRLDRIGMRILGAPSLSSVEWVWLKVVLTGKTDAAAKFVMVDEVQDYSEAQLMVLSRYYSRAHFLLLGDPNQAIRPGTASFGRIRAVFEAARGSVDECALTTSYRSTPEITDLFARLADEDDGMRISSVHRPGVTPRLVECPAPTPRDAFGTAAGAAGGDGSDVYVEAIAREVDAAREQGGLAAVVVDSRRRLHWLAERLAAVMGEAAPAPRGTGAPERAPAAHGPAPLVMGDGASLPQEGVVMLTLELAKGLEFDHVIVADAQASEFPATPLARRRLYTAISRATRRVTLVSQGPLTELLAGALDEGSLVGDALS